MYVYDWGPVLGAIPRLVGGLVGTIQLAVLSFVTALALGLLIALARRSSLAPLRALAYAYVQTLRSMSHYIFILWIYFGLAIVLGINLSPFEAGVVTVGMVQSAYVAEVCRAAFASIHAGQREAAASLGLGPIYTLIDVLFPQALRFAAPMLVTELIQCVKGVAIVAAIGGNELMYVATQFVNTTLRPFEFYTATALIYVTLVTVIGHGGSHLERRLRHAK